MKKSISENRMVDKLISFISNLKKNKNWQCENCGSKNTKELARYQCRREYITYYCNDCEEMTDVSVSDYDHNHSCPEENTSRYHEINNLISELFSEDNEDLECETSDKMVYLAGDMLKVGSILLRNQEKKDIKRAGFKVYSPVEDKEINDKSNQTEESNAGLAEKIVFKDTKAIIESDIIVIEPQDNAIGTMIELGQIKGMKDVSKMIINILSENQGRSEKIILEQISNLCYEMDGKIVFPHYEDIRRTDIPEQGDRRSWGVNQYCYGVCLDLTEGKGFYEWDEIINNLKEIKEDENV